MGNPLTPGAPGGRTNRFGGCRNRGCGGSGGNRGQQQSRNGGQQTQQTISRRDCATTATFLAGCNYKRIDALKIPLGVKQGARLMTTYQTLGTLALSKGTVVESVAAAKIETGVPHTFILVATAALNPCRIKHDYLLPVSLMDYFTNVTDEEDEDKIPPPTCGYESTNCQHPPKENLSRLTPLRPQRHCLPTPRPPWPRPARRGLDQPRGDP